MGHILALAKVFCLKNKQQTKMAKKQCCVGPPRQPCEVRLYREDALSLPCPQEVGQEPLVDMPRVRQSGPSCPAIEYLEMSENPL